MDSYLTLSSQKQVGLRQNFGGKTYILYISSTSQRDYKEIQQIIRNARIKMGIDISPSEIITRNFPFEIRGQFPSIYELATERYYVGLQEVLSFYRQKLFSDRSAHPHTQRNIISIQPTKPTKPKDTFNAFNPLYTTTSAAHVFQSNIEDKNIVRGQGQYHHLFKRDPSLPSMDHIGGGGLPQ